MSKIKYKDKISILLQAFDEAFVSLGLSEEEAENLTDKVFEKATNRFEELEVNK